MTEFYSDSDFQTESPSPFSMLYFLACGHSFADSAEIFSLKLSQIPSLELSGGILPDRKQKYPSGMIVSLKGSSGARLDAAAAWLFAVKSPGID